MSFALSALFFCSRIWSISINSSFFPGPVMNERPDDHVTKQDLRQICDFEKNAEDFSSASRRGDMAASWLAAGEWMDLANRQRLTVDPFAIGERRPGEARVHLMDDFVSPGRLQVTDDAVHRGLPHPGHHSFQIHAGAKMSGCERRPELVKPEIFRVQFGFVCVSLECANHVRVGSSAPCAEDECARCRAPGRQRFSIDFE